MHIVVIKGLNDRNAEISLLASVFVDLKGKKVSQETSGCRRHENANMSGSQTLILYMKRLRNLFRAFFRDELESVLHLLPRC